MKKNIDMKIKMHILCAAVRKYSNASNYEKCVELIREAMSECPDAPEPHNLLGVVLESEGDHSEAMRHFRAACALDPTYLPAQQNLEHFGTFFAQGKCAYDEDDCPKEDSDEYKFEQDELDTCKEE